MDESEVIVNLISQQAIKTGVEQLVKKAFSIGSEKRQTVSSNTPSDFHKRIEDYQIKRAEGLSALAALALGNRKVHLSQVYIPLTIVSSEQDLFSEIGPWRILEWPETLFNNVSRLLIKDRAGMGKSTLLKYLYLSCLSKRVCPAIFLELRSLKALPSLEDEVAHELGRFINKSVKCDLNTDASEGRWMLFLDGFDEVPKDRKGKVLDQIQRFCENFDNVSVILSSRSDDTLLGLRGFNSYSIKPLRKEEAYALLRKYDFDSGIAESLIADIEKQNQEMIFQFLENPLLVTLLYKAYSFKTTIPFKKSTFYRQVYDALYESHDLSKGDGYVHPKACGLNLDDFHRALRFIAKLTFPDGLKEYEKDEILSKFEFLSASSVLPKFKPTDLLEDLVSTVPVFIKDGSIYRWAHKSLQDYFMACFINSEIDGDKAAQVVSLIGSESKISANENVIDVLYDLKIESVEESIVRPFLEDFLDYITKTRSRSTRVNEEEYYFRQVSLFRRQILIGVYPKEALLGQVVHEDLGDRPDVLKKQRVDINNVIRDIETCSGVKNLGEVRLIREFNYDHNSGQVIVMVELIENGVNVLNVISKMLFQRHPEIFYQPTKPNKLPSSIPEWLPRNSLMRVDLDLRKIYNKDENSFIIINDFLKRVAPGSYYFSEGSVRDLVNHVSKLSAERESGRGIFSDTW